MLDFSKIEGKELTDFKRILIKNIEKSEFESYYLFSIKTIEKVKVFTLCYRFLLNSYNLMDKGDLKDEIGKEIVDLKELYKDCLIYLDQMEDKGIGYHQREDRMMRKINTKGVNNLIDIFSVLTEKVSIVSMSRMKGVVLEGSSGTEFKRIMSPDG